MRCEREITGENFEKKKVRNNKKKKNMERKFWER
jgi:hypothetical protein